MKKLEEMARAHHESDLAIKAGLEAPWERLPEGVKQFKMNAMRAAVACQREPNDAMKEAANKANMEDGVWADYQAMIDAMDDKP